MTGQDCGLIKPAPLNKGDKIALVSPSAPLARLIPHRTEAGIKKLKALGFDVVVSPHALAKTDYTAGSPADRASDINAAFADPTIKGIICFIGGFHSNHLLKYLDYGLIAKNPKVFIGYSDISVLHFALQQKARLVTFYGPAVLTQFADPYEMDAYTLDYFEKAVCRSGPVGKIESSPQWTDELLNWFAKEDTLRPRAHKDNPGYKWLRSGKCEGSLLGGCLTSIHHLRGTEYWPSFKGKIFFWEIAEGTDLKKGEPPAKVDSYLCDLHLSGVFDQCVGMVVGRPVRYTPDETILLEKIILERTSGYNFPILFNVNIGHADPIITLPLGIRGSLDSGANAFSLLETGTAA
jgi:muramoyltetrapeptide carboxypeptidase